MYLRQISLIFVVIIFTFNNLNATHTELNINQGKKLGIIKENSRAKTVVNFYKTLQGSLDVRLNYYFKIESDELFNEISNN